MSVILDALHKARGDRRGAAAEPHEQTVARVVDAGLAPQNASIAEPARSGGGRGIVIALAVLCGLVLLVALVGGAFFLLYDQMRRIETVATQPTTGLTVSGMPAGPLTAAPAAGPVAGMQQAIPPAPVQAAVLQTPIPLSELPVQAPAAQSAPPAMTKPDFELGSIVCENNDCLASLNNRSVRVGDTVKGYKVAKIDSTSITLTSEVDGSEITLSLFD